MTWNIDPVLFFLGPLEIRYYGVLFAAALTLAYFTARAMAKRSKLDLKELDDLILYLVIGLVVGARLGHIAFYELDYYLANPLQILQVWNGGLASHGGAIGAFLAYGLFLKTHKKVKFWDYLDIIAVVASFPAALIRLGNFFNSELVGRPSSLPWAITFERVDLIARHPSQLYEFGMGALLIALLVPLWFKKHKSAKPGLFAGLFMTLYFAMRFTVEFVKDFDLHAGLTTGQWLSIPFFLIGVYLLARKK